MNKKFEKKYKYYLNIFKDPRIHLDGVPQSRNKSVKILRLPHEMETTLQQQHGSKVNERGIYYY
jgi:hypothetical protein